MATKKNTELAPVDSFKIVKRYEGLPEELKAQLEDELDDLEEDAGISCRTIKLPSGGSLAFEVQGDTDQDTDYRKTIDGVIVFTHRLNGYWASEMGSSDNKVPDCASIDAKTGVVTATGEVRTCENCPNNFYGTDSRGRGKACKNMRRIYLIMDGDPNLYLLTVPPTSIKEINKQLRLIVSSGTPYSSIISRFTLERATNAANIAYSKVKVERAGSLPPAMAAQVAELRQGVKEKYKSMAVTANDYNTGDAQRPATRGVDVQMDDVEFHALDGDDPGGSEPLPFAD